MLKEFCQDHVLCHATHLIDELFPLIDFAEMSPV